ncbi:MAG: Glu-tRNA(Gln) amidotransferase subunit GatE [Spirochaetales bacterium]|nr:Glu-tRNA(Gln) amidotransferase subunit GatE [Spirochaetales bacterium]
MPDNLLKPAASRGPMRLDCEAAGLKCGLEIHYQLDTPTKLFCRCPVGLRNDPHDAEIVRHMRPTLSELGEYDGTALMEFKTRKEVHYQLHYGSVCTYEMDDTPPFLLNRQALDIALEIALLLNCQVVDEIHVSRKQYLDGSIPTGFQRTIAVGVNGWIPFRGRRIGILQLCLEEDACREVSDRGHVIVFRADRLSTPLVEVITAADMRTPEEAMEVDRELGRILRATGKVRRGMGSVRQDVNVSVAGGTRAEIKGVPRTGRIERLVYSEGVRQCALLALKGELEARGVIGDDFAAASRICTDLFDKTDSAAIGAALREGGVVGAVKLGGFGGLLAFPVSPGRTFADEIRGRVRVIACLDRPPILFHTDDTDPSDGLSRAEVDRLRRALAAEPADAIVVVWGAAEDVATALQEVEARAREATLGVPNETRQALADGTTDFERILPGPNRMYPDTDSAPIPVEAEHLESIRSGLPVSPVSWRERYGDLLPQELISRLIDAGTIGLFHELHACTQWRPKLLAHTLASTLPHLARRKVEAAEIPLPRLAGLFEACARGLLPAEALPAGLVKLVQGAEVQEVCAELAPPQEAQVRAAAAEALAALGSPGGWRCREPEPRGIRLRMRDFLIGGVKRRLGLPGAGESVRRVVEELLAAQRPAEDRP